jgi:hypothetical protein
VTSAPRDSSGTPLHGLLSSYLDDVRRHLGSDRLVTLVVRRPDDPAHAHTIVIGNDKPEAAIAAIEWSKQTDAVACVRCGSPLTRAQIDRRKAHFRHRLKALGRACAGPYCSPKCAAMDRSDANATTVADTLTARRP